KCRVGQETARVAVQDKKMAAMEAEEKPGYTPDGKRIVFPVGDAFFGDLADFGGESQATIQEAAKQAKEIGPPPATRGRFDQEGTAAVGTGSAGSGQEAARYPCRASARRLTPPAVTAPTTRGSARLATSIQREAALGGADAEIESEAAAGAPASAASVNDASPVARGCDATAGVQTCSAVPACVQMQPTQPPSNIDFRIFFASILERGPVASKFFQGRASECARVGALEARARAEWLLPAKAELSMDGWWVVSAGAIPW
ncbi:unnamed protein product, partial [Prorocentrum cordatum]